jgi:hypothetical protein
MSKIKNHFHDEIVKGQNLPDDTDWNAPSSQLDPPPEQIDLQTGKGMWTINDYRIWATSYKEALELLPIIESM